MTTAPTWIDAVLALVLLLALASGLRRGLALTLGSALGLLAGVAAAVLFAVPLGGLVPDPAWRPLAVVAAGVLLVVLGQGIGLRIGAAVRRALGRGALSRADGLLGGVAGLAVAAVVIALAAPVARPLLPADAADEAGRSRVVAAAEHLTPEPVRQAATDLGTQARLFVAEAIAPVLPEPGLGGREAVRA